MATAVIEAAQAAMDRLRSAVYIPLDRYYHLLPKMPRGETPADLVKMGFPHASDLIDGLLLVVFLTVLRVVLTPLVLDWLGRAAMRHRYYRTPPNPTLDAMLLCVRACVRACRLFVWVV
jgi:hypothetical protein